MVIAAMINYTYVLDYQFVFFQKCIALCDPLRKELP